MSTSCLGGDVSLSLYSFPGFLPKFRNFATTLSSLSSSKFPSPRLLLGLVVLRIVGVRAILVFHRSIALKKEEDEYLLL